MENPFRLGRIAGIEVGIHVSWLIVFALLTFSLATGYFPMAVEGIGTGMSWLLGSVATVLLFGSVLVHELAHSFMARARGLEAVGAVDLLGEKELTSEAISAWWQQAVTRRVDRTRLRLDGLERVVLRAGGLETRAPLPARPAADPEGEGRVA